MTKEMFDGESARLMMRELRETYSSGKTRSYEWRISQLNNLLKIAEFHEKEIVEALRSDISKPEFETFVHEVCVFYSMILCFLVCVVVFKCAILIILRLVDFVWLIMIYEFTCLCFFVLCFLRLS